MRELLALVAVLGLAVFVAGCGSSDRSQAESEAAVGEAEDVALADAEAGAPPKGEEPILADAEAEVPPKTETGEVPEGTLEQFGQRVTLQESMAIADLTKNPEKHVDKIVRIEGVVTGVCKGSGCWVEVQSPDGASVIAKSSDHSVCVPRNCEGRTIVVQGKFLKMEPRGEPEERDHAEGEEPHVCPQPVYLISLDAVELGASAS